MIHILIGGDVCPMGKIQNAFIQGKAHEIFNDLLDEITNADLSIANLECPLISKETPILKVGRILGACPKTIHGFKAAKWQLLNLANNHIFDHGILGLRETVHTIKEGRINFVGGGMNIEEAKVPFVTYINGQRIVIYSMAEHEFSVADQNTPGANPLDIINFVNAITLYKQQGIFIVLLHGGIEHYPYPSPEMVRRCRFMVDMGADAVICCHTHCPLPWEIHKDKPIVYGLGNLIFEPPRKKPDTFYRGYLARLTIDEQRIGLEVVPYNQLQKKVGAHKMNENEREQFFKEMNQKNELLRDSKRLSDLWLDYCRQQKDIYMSGLFAYSPLMRKLNDLLLKILHPKVAVLGALLLVQCEAHREVLSTVFRNIRDVSHERA
jgi:poly-gamma-glutamate synthesis protein (capsule biosynthesis protein)